MRMEKRKFRIGELAEQLQLEKFVIRFWEKEFSIKGTRSSGGQRFYEENDITTFNLIKDLLYNRGFTIAGAKKQLVLKSVESTKIIGSHKTTISSDNLLHKELVQQLMQLRKQLVKLKKLLSSLSVNEYNDKICIIIYRQQCIQKKHTYTLLVSAVLA